MEADEGTKLIIKVFGANPTVVGPTSDAGWNDLIAAAGRHGLGPYVYKRLKRSLRAAPRAVADQLHDLYVEAAATSLWLRRDLGRILGEYHSRGIPVVPLKGAYLGEGVYGDSALRLMMDIDLLVRPADLSQAVACLRALGYETKHAFDPRAEQAVSQHMPVMGGQGRTPVELHWTLVHPACGARIGPSELGDIWSRSVPATIAGERVQVLAPEDLLLHLCMHASVQHAFGDIGLRPFVDIAEVVRRHGEALNWMEFVGRTNRWGVANGVRMVLTLAREWTDLAVPAAVWAQLDGTPPDEKTLGWARQKILDGGPAELASGFPRLASEAGRNGRLSALRTAAFPPRAEVARNYGVRADSWRILSCYTYRWWDLWRRYRSALWKLLTRDRQFVEEIRREARLREYLGWS